MINWGDWPQSGSTSEMQAFISATPKLVLFIHDLKKGDFAKYVVLKRPTQQQLYGPIVCATHHALDHPLILPFTSHAEPICWTELTTSMAEVNLQALVLISYSPTPQ